MGTIRNIKVSISANNEEQLRLAEEALYKDSDGFLTNNAWTGPTEWYLAPEIAKQIAQLYDVIIYVHETCGSDKYFYREIMIDAEDINDFLDFEDLLILIILAILEAI